MGYFVNVTTAHCDNDITLIGNITNCGNCFAEILYAGTVIETDGNIFGGNTVGIISLEPIMGVRITLSAILKALIKSSFKSAVLENVKG